MKCRLARIVTIALVALCLPWTLPAENNVVALKWGIENKGVYRERADLGQNQWAKDLLPGQVRYMAYREPPPPEWFECVDSRHWAIWERFQAAEPDAARLSSEGPGSFTPEELDTLRQSFFAYRRQQDPYCAKVFQDKAPVLYFDFVSNSGKTYILEKIEIQTIDFGEYRGGGFFWKEAWYDVLLSHEPGIRSYVPDKRLEFVSTGRVELRFWSDNYYPSVGWLAPMGAYVLRITFQFTVEGKSVSVSTPAFMMDV